MKILIITQVIDKNHSILGFFHRWVEEFAKNCEEVHVVCLYEGEHTLPNNVIIHSLGKDKKEVSSFRYGLRLLKFSWQLRKKYDTVFVHMNPEYVLAGVLIWKILHKKISMWYAHGAITNKLKLATIFSDVVFTSTENSFRLNTSKKQIVGQGIDTEVFTAPQQKERRDFLELITVGRVAPVKNIETLLLACAELVKDNVTFHFTIVGAPLNDMQYAYKRKLDELVREYSLEQYVSFIGSVTQAQLPAVLKKADIFISDGTIALDKALLEASACGLVVISSNESYVALVKEVTKKEGLSFPVHNHSLLKEAILFEGNSHQDGARKISNYIKNNYSITKMVKNIIREL